MATYGTNNGTVPFTGYTGTLGTTPLNGAVSGTVYRNGLTHADDTISKLFRRPGARKQRELLLTLIGTVAGSTAAETRKRVKAIVADVTSAQYGGVRTMESVAIVNRVTTAADVTALTALLNRQPYPVTYAHDVSGNSSGQLRA